MKLDRRRTILIGFAFLSICAFWQMYDMIVPLILRDTYHIGDGVSGVIMAMDNILALFMLPLFGRLSDRCTAKMGRRMPFIVFGTAAAIVSLMALGLAQRHGDLIPVRLGLHHAHRGLRAAHEGGRRLPRRVQRRNIRNRA